MLKRSCIVHCFPDAIRLALFVLLGLAMTACGGDQSTTPVPRSAPVQVVAGSSSTAAAPHVPAPPLGPMPAPLPAADSKITPVSDSEQLKRLAAVPLLASLSAREKAGLLERLVTATPSERRALISAYPSLNRLPEQQLEGLLKQLDLIVPVTTPAQELICMCGADVQQKICVRESCADAPALASRCNAACGSLAAFGSQCRPARQCAP